MTLLRLELTGSLNAEHGVTNDQLDGLAGKLLPIRADVLQTEAFVCLPEQQLADYEAHREDAMLGRIFKVANGMHNDIDAVVVLGIGGSHVGARALMDACCEPYHNELSRGGRGSKPRMYFAGNNFDNDATAALLSRLAAGGYGDSPAEQRHAIIVLSASDNTLETATALRQFLSAMECSLAVDTKTWLGRLVIPVAGEQSKLRELATEIGCAEVFTVPAELTGHTSVLSAVGLMPAAMLGLDCMKLLEGAALMNEHFRSAAPPDNLVWRFATVNHLLAKHRQKSTRVLSVWNQSLESVGHWYDHLLAHSLASAPIGVTPLTMVNTRDLPSRHRQHLHGPRDKVFNNLSIENWRSDRLAVGNSNRNQDGLNSLADRTLPELMDAATQAANDELHQSGHPTTDIILPTIDTYVLGQLFQMLMLATAVERRLQGDA